MSLRQLTNRYRTYTAYSIGCFIVWAVILTAVSTTATHEKRTVFFTVFAGWAIGWLSATIARSVYPHPGAKLR
jgi:hypothetical protein